MPDDPKPCLLIVYATCAPLSERVEAHTHTHSHTHTHAYTHRCQVQGQLWDHDGHGPPPELHRESLHCVE